MKKPIKLLLLGIILLLVSCGTFERQMAKFSGYSKICVDHVTYLQFTSGATVQVDINGKPIKCN